MAWDLCKEVFESTEDARGNVVMAVIFLGEKGRAKRMQMPQRLNSYIQKAIVLSHAIPQAFANLSPTPTPSALRHPRHNANQLKTDKSV